MNLSENSLVIYGDICDTVEND